jgi:hypothetical protein
MINCTKCGENKDECYFRPRPTLKRGFQSWCKECEYKQNRQRYIPKERIKNDINPDEVKLLAKKRMLKHRYSLGYDEYIRMYDKQNGKCLICGVKKELGSSKGLMIDHCHNTNEVRGLLCRNCNSGLGQFMDDTNILLNAIKYLNKTIPPI